MAASWSVVEAAAREAYGRLVALLAARSGDLAGAEDALADALLAALEHWPNDGIPASPQAWLFTVARRRLIDGARRRTRADRAQAELVGLHEEGAAAMDATQPFPDVRLGLMLACAHPAVDAAARTPLMLQSVLGLTAERMASAFLTSPAAMTKRLVRAKARLATTGVRFQVPDGDVLPERLEPLLDAVYAAFTLGLAETTDCGTHSLTGEALWLGRLLWHLVPAEPETAGLLSLMLFVAARRTTPAAAYVPLSAQDPAAWHEEYLVEAEGLLRAAGSQGRPGRYQFEAAIQAVHVDRRRSGYTDWPAIVQLYGGLVAWSPTIGARIARAAALAQAGDPKTALRALEALDPDLVVAYQPFWATRAHVLAMLGLRTAAADAYQRAAGLTESTPVRIWLLERLAALAV